MTRKHCKNAEPGTAHAKRPAPYPGPRCATCHRLAKRERTKNSHDKRVQEIYGLRPGEYQLLLVYQDGVCFICRRAKGIVKRLAVDHDHALEHLGRESVRGLLCGACNKMLGHARDDVEFFARAIRYLLNPPAQQMFQNLFDAEG